MIVHDVAKKLGLHSDEVVASLRAIPTEIAMDLTRQQVEDLVLSITEHSRKVWNDAAEYVRKSPSMQERKK